jgi:uncharacterized protein YbaP (TraB family)
MLAAISLGRMAASFFICIAGLLSLAPARADPALWVVKSESATAYLFGTIHILPNSMSWMDPAIRNALNASSELWTEADVSNLSGAVNAIRHYGLTSAQDTAMLLPPAYRERYRQQIDKAGLSPTLIAHARPWLAEILLTGAAMQKAGPMGMGAEAMLLGYARDHHLATRTFETVDGQFALLADMPQDAQVASLEEQIDEFDQAGALFTRMIKAWQSGDEAGLDKLVGQEMRSHSEMVWTELILRRNERFAQRISERLQGQGTIFVAVGAAHMCGLDGVPALLKNYGFTVTRLQ